VFVSFHDEASSSFSLLRAKLDRSRSPPWYLPTQYLIKVRSPKLHCVPQSISIAVPYLARRGYSRRNAPSLTFGGSHFMLQAHSLPHASMLVGTQSSPVHNFRNPGKRRGNTQSTHICTVTVPGSMARGRTIHCMNPLRQDSRGT
jgi:hypothetical protein